MCVQLLISFRSIGEQQQKTTWNAFYQQKKAYQSFYFRGLRNKKYFWSQS